MTGSALVLAGTPDEIGQLAPLAMAEIVTHALVESKSWLAVATQGTDPTPIAEFKQWAACIAEMTKQKGLASEIQSDASEMLRRAERGIGVAIRNGQAAGEIRTRQDRVDIQDLNIKPSPRQFVAGGQTISEIYALTDGVSDEQFDTALTDARDEGNLSRVNVVRKLQAIIPEMGPVSQQLERVVALADRGYTSDQIARELGVGEDWIKKVAKTNSLDIPADRVMGRSRRTVDRTRLVQRTVISLEGLASSLQFLDDQLTGVDLDDAPHWVASLTDSLKALTRLKNQLKETTQ
jgi:DNA-binding NarL/FixJ family response regulator